MSYWRYGWRRRLGAILAGALTMGVVVSGCATHPAALRSLALPLPWEKRLTVLQRANNWQLDGRVAVAVGSQGWQATLNWRQVDGLAELHLAGPLGVGALALKQTAAGLSLNGAPPSAQVVAQLEDKLGFDLPLDELRFWVLGVPDPDGSCDLKRNAQDRVEQLIQGGWTVVYEKYMPVAGDALPARFVVSREGVRVRIAVDHWQSPR